jgi:hypothetical protein
MAANRTIIVIRGDLFFSEKLAQHISIHRAIEVSIRKDNSQRYELYAITKAGAISAMFSAFNQLKRIYRDEYQKGIIAFNQNGGLFYYSAYAIIT